MQVERKITIFVGMRERKMRSAEEYLRGLRLKVLIIIHDGAAMILHRLFCGPKESVMM